MNDDGEREKTDAARRSLFGRTRGDAGTAQRFGRKDEGRLGLPITRDAFTSRAAGDVPFGRPDFAASLTAYAADADAAIAYRIRGVDAQIVEFALEPGQSVAVAAGLLISKDPAVAIAGSGVLVSFVNEGEATAHLAAATPIPSGVLALRMADVGARLDCAHGAVVATSRDVDVDPAADSPLGAGRMALSGAGYAFLAVPGFLIERELEIEETLDVAATRVVAVTDDAAVWPLPDGETLGLVRIEGPGKLWLSSVVAADKS